MDELKRRLDALIDRLADATEFRQSLQTLPSVYPFNRIEYTFAHLLAAQVVTLQEYVEFRVAYLHRNKYLYLFEMSSPRGFGEIWAQSYLCEFAPELARPSKQLDAHLARRLA